MRENWKPYALVVPFSALITGLFNLSSWIPWPLAVVIGAAWGCLIGLIATRIGARPRVADGLIVLGTAGFAFAGCGGLMAILLLNGALNSTSLTGEALEQMFLPSIPYYIAVNSILELLIIPAVLYVAWRPGRRRILIVAAAVLYFAMRVWTYLAFVPARLGWADSDHSIQPLSDVERAQAAKDLMLDDPRWILLLIMFVLFVLAAFLRPADGDVEEGYSAGGDQGADYGPEGAAGHGAAFEVAEALEGPDRADGEEEDAAGDGEDLSHGVRLVEEGVAEVDELPAEWAGAIGEGSLGGGVLGFAGRGLDRHRHVAQGSEVVGGGAHVEGADVAGQFEAVQHQRARRERHQLGRPFVEVHVGVQATALFQCWLGFARRLQDVQRSGR
ncbi:hypothetical protein AB0L70_10420 [Kribbella sp. NPDC051952]|uniref:hypothetical protein n=1 Tax=Kribbella sp. NPDC051952 TaxID=3154851 RepID=UPI0034285EB6